MVHRCGEQGRTTQNLPVARRAAHRCPDNAAITKPFRAFFWSLCGTKEKAGRWFQRRPFLPPG